MLAVLHVDVEVGVELEAEAEALKLVEDALECLLLVRLGLGVGHCTVLCTYVVILLCTSLTGAACVPRKMKLLRRSTHGLQLHDEEQVGM